MPNQPFDLDGIAYSWPAASAGAVDNDQANGQVLPVVPVPNATTLGVLGAANNGATSGTATLTFDDGTSQPFQLGFTDWAQSTLAFGNTIAASMTYRNTPSGKQTITANVFAADVPIPQGKTLVSVTLPSSVSGGQLHVFALGTRAGLNNLGSSNDSQPGAGNYDGGGRSWSIQTLEAASIQPGQPLIFNGVNFTWPASYGTTADNYLAAGQTIPVTPVPGATTLAFLGTSTNHTSSGTATITYTDGTHSTFPLGLTDWWDNNIQFGNKLVATFSTINIPGGTKSGSFYLYYAETALTPGKTIQSVTLPATATVSPGQLHIFAVGTRSDYNNIGISDNSDPTQANFDGAGNSYSAQDFADPTVAGWNPGDTLTYEGINYIWPNVASGQGDNYVADGQTIQVTAPQGATTLGFVGAGDFAYPTTSGTATLTYMNGSTTTITLGMTDWLMDSDNIKPVPNEHLFALLPHHNSGQKTMAALSYLFEVETPLDKTKQLQSVTLPATVSQGRLHIFMLGTRTGEDYPNNVGTSHDGNTVFANLDGVGASYSIEALEGQGIFPGQPSTFNGVTFTWPDSASVLSDNFQANGQTIPVTPVSGATTLAFLGASTNTGGSGVDSGSVTITYTDGTSSTPTLSITDWYNGSALSGNQVVVTCTSINNADGQLTHTVHLYYAEVRVTSGKTIQSVQLPSTVSSGQMHIFAIGTK